MGVEFMRRISGIFSNPLNDQANIALTYIKDITSVPGLGV